MLSALTSFYWALLPQFLAESLWYADWRGKGKKYGYLIGIPIELIRTLFTLNSFAFKVQSDKRWSGRLIANLLAQKGIPTYGWAWYEKGVMIFHVPIRFADWAEYLMIRTGVPFAPPEA